MQIDNKLILEYSKNLTVLYVEDSETIRNSTYKIFSHYFKQVDLAEDGNDGFEKYISFYKDNDSYYDLVITDINMPHLNGIEMSKNIAHENFTQAIIFITAHNEIDYLSEAINLGVHGFLVKPLELESLKHLLYKATQAIYDRKMVERYCKEVEESNIMLMQEHDKKESVKTVLEFIDDIELHKDDITKRWVDSGGVKEKLRLHVIDEEFFRTHYAIKVLEYFIGVVKGDKELGNCPVIIAMLEFLKQKKLPLDSIFVICVNFKNIMTSFVFEKYRFNHELFDELSLILDKNFEGVIFNYMDMKLYEQSENIVDEEVQQEKPQESSEVIDYCDYVFEHDIYELQDLEVEIENLAITVTMNNQKSVDDFLILGEKVRKYGNLLISYPIFADLGAYIFKLGNSFTDNAELLFEDKQKILNISTLIEGFVNDLMLWRREIFENNIADPNFLNASFFSNVDTIIQYIEYDEENDTAEDEIEFF